MRNPPTILITLIALIAFAGNSLLCRAALRDTAIDAGSFTAVRIVSGALALCLIVVLRSKNDTDRQGSGNWRSALALFVYAATFSFAYVEMASGTGALLLFGAVQATMIGAGLWRGEKFGAAQSVGLGIAGTGLILSLIHI